MDSTFLTKAAGGLLGTAFIMMTLSIVSDAIYHTETPETPGFAIVAEAASEGGAAETAEPEGIEPIAPLLASADAAAGETVFKKCAACHSNDASGANKVGPGLWGVVNRPIASHEGFKYSGAMTEFAQGGSVVWDYDHLNEFLAAPKKYISGTSMGFAGLKKADERANVIAYLRSLAETPAPLPGQ